MPRIDLEIGDLLAIFDRPIAFHRIFVDITGSVSGAIFLSQLFYWCNGRGSDSTGWIYKTQIEWYKETGLRRREQESIRRLLVTNGILKEERRGIPCRIFYKIDNQKFNEVLRNLIDTKNSGSVEFTEQNKSTMLSQYARIFRELSKSALYRAEQASLPCENVDYGKVLQEHDFTCYLCGMLITQGPGQSPGSLQFDHIISIDKGGGHVRSNVAPVHARCNYVKSNHDAEDILSDPYKLDEIRDSLLEPNVLGSMRYANQTASDVPSNSETTTKTTTEITDSAQAQTAPVTDLFGDVLPTIPRNVDIPKPIEPKPVKEPEITAAGVRKQLQDGIWKRAVEVAWRSYCVVSGQASADTDLLPKCVWTSYDFKILRELLKAADNDIERFTAACRVYYRYDNEYGRKSGFALQMFRSKWQECITIANRGIRAKHRHIDQDARSESNDSNRSGANNEPVTTASLLRRFKETGTTSAG